MAPAKRLSFRSHASITDLPVGQGREEARSASFGNGPPGPGGNVGGVDGVGVVGDVVAGVETSGPRCRATGSGPLVRSGGFSANASVATRNSARG